MKIRERVQLLRKEMAREGYHAYIIPSADPHQSEYPPARWLSREWITGFGGSAGTAVITRQTAGLWTDSRYFLAAEHDLAGSGIQLFKEGEPDVPGFTEWLAKELEAGEVAAFDAGTFSLHDARSLSTQLSAQGITVVPADDLVDRVWGDRPSLPGDPIYAHEARFSGKSRGEKLSFLRQKLKELGATHHVVSTLDDIAWLLNLRGSDVPFNPVFVAHFIISPDSAVLFTDPKKINRDLQTALADEGVAVRPYDEFMPSLGELAEDSTLLLSPTQVSAALHASLPASCRMVEALNPSTLMKAQKNGIELENLNRAMARDGKAMVRFLHWLHSSLASGEPVTELSAEKRLREFRADGEHFVSESFRTIAAYRGHGAVVHYAAPESGASSLEPAGLFLLDSGGQYLDGTTDITRTIALGPVSEQQRREYTLVLKAHLTLSDQKFPAGTTGLVLDGIARHKLWKHRLNYRHGTGHGVGFFLNVHEGPQRLAQKRSDQPLRPGMIVSNEPGLYRTDAYGIRIENVLVVEEDEPTEYGPFYRFKTLTLCPYDRTLIDLDLLTSDEVEWIDTYHRTVRERLRGFLDPEVATWLDDACAPLDTRGVQTL